MNSSVFISYELPLISKPQQSVWICLVVLALLGAASASLVIALPVSNPPQPRNPTAAIVFGTISLLCVVGGALLTYWMLRARIEADEDGLRWRGLGEWKSVPWSDVQDYYQTDGEQGTRAYAVQTKAGKLQFSRTSHQASEALARVIAARATSASAQTWEPLECRRQDTETRRFFYSRLEIQGAILFFSLMGAALFVCMPPTALFHFGATRQNLGLSWAFGGVIGYFFVIATGVAPCSILISTAWRSLQNAGQTIETSSQGIVFTDGGHRIEAAWDEIVQYGVPQDTILSALRGEFQVKTARGEFSFSQYMRRYAQLRRIIRHWAPESASLSIRQAAQDTLGGEAARWTGGHPGIGERTFHYRTRSNRALLWYVLSLACMPIIGMSLRRWLGVGVPVTGVDLIVASAIPALLMAWLCWRYSAARIEIDETGILERSAFGARRLPWAEVKSVATGEYVTVVRGECSSVRFWNSIAYAAELQDEIKRRASVM